MKHQMNRSIKTALACVGFLLGSVTTYGDEVAVSASELLEEGVYLHEGKGDLDAAIERYKQVIELDSKNLARAAEAQYRLAVCYLEKGDEPAAVRAFEALVSDYPSQEKWVDAALEHLPQEFRPSLIPWEDGERTQLEIRVPNGDIIGYVILGVSSLETDGRFLWESSFRQFVGGMDALDSATFDSESMLTTGGRYYDTNSGFVSYSYEEGLVRTWYQKNGNERELAYDGNLYGNGQVLALVRQIPPKVEFSTEQEIYAPLAGLIISLNLKVIKIEFVDTPIGQLECYNVQLDMTGQKQYIWVSNDEQRRIVKLSVGGMEMFATQFDVVDSDAMMTHENEHLGIAFEHPNPWAAIETNVSGGSAGKSRVELREYNSLTTISVATSRYEKEGEEATSNLERARKIAESNIKAYKQQWPDFEVDGSSRSEFEINGASAVSYTGEMLMAGSPSVAKKIIVFSEGRRVIFTMRSPHDEVGTVLPMFDEMASSLVID